MTDIFKRAYKFVLSPFFLTFNTHMDFHLGFVSRQITLALPNLRTAYSHLHSTPIWLPPPLFKTDFKPIAIFIWAGPLTLAALITTANLLTFALTSNHTYYLGVDLDTPKGPLTKQSMVKITDERLPWKSLNQFTRSKILVEGEAVYCDLNDGQHLIMTLAFPKDPTGNFTLHKLPWIANNYPIKPREKWLPFYGDRTQLPKNSCLCSSNSMTSMITNRSKESFQSRPKLL